MSYIDNNLAAGEKIIYRCKPHWIIFAPAILLLMFGLFLLQFGANLVMVGTNLYKVAALFSFIFAILSGAANYIMYTTAEYGVTNKRLIMKIGFIQQRIIEVPLVRVESILVYQNLIGRIIGYGNVTISGVGGTKDLFKNIPYPNRFRTTVQNLLDKIAEPHANK